MPVLGFPHNLLNGLSDFWMRFFADADQLAALYQGTAIQLGQAYLDLMSATLGVTLRDARVWDREYYRLLTFREDELRYVAGTTTDDDRWALTLPEDLVTFASVDNKVVEPTASLEPFRDYDLVDGEIRFRADPTNPLNTGVPLNGFARRTLDVAVGGRFTNAAATDWTASAVRKGDTLRVLDVSPAPDLTQRKRADYPITLLRSTGMFVAAATPLPTPATGVTFVVLRVPADAQVSAESFTLVSDAATLAHTRLDAGSVRVYAKGPTGADVVEGVDYLINYEHGTLLALTTWANTPGPYGIDYTWQEEVYPTSGTSPRRSTTGVIAATTTTTRVLQLAAWTPDAYVDRRTLANNFGALIGAPAASSEAYRTFLAGIFQLYLLGPVLARLESALNVVLNLPVVRDDGETYLATDTTDLLVDRVTTRRPATGLTATYTFPKGVALRTDLVVGQALLAFEPLTTAVTVTDYVETPSWWHGAQIPRALFDAATVPSPGRRTASPFYVEHVLGASDDPRIGDPGLMIGTDETGVVLVPAPAHIYRHRMAFVLMDRYLKYHTFTVRFDATVLAAALAAGAFTQNLDDLNRLVLSAKPAHTYIFTAATTDFRDEIEVTETEISFDRRLGSRVYGPDKVLFADAPPAIGAGIWDIGDYFAYALYTEPTVFAGVGVPVALAHTVAGPRHRRLVRVDVLGDVGGVALVENVDYTVDYAAATVTPLTVWTSTTVDVTYRQLDIGNLADAPPDDGDMPVLIGGIDPAIIAPAYNPAAAGWDGVTTPITAPRDLGLVERPLTVTVTIPVHV